MGKEQSFQQTVLGKLDSHMLKNEVNPYLTPYANINSKQIIDLNVRAKTIKLLDENTGVNFCDLGLGNIFLDMTPKAQATTKNTNKWLHQKI